MRVIDESAITDAAIDPSQITSTPEETGAPQ
jgi:hypothetical protein